jgi:hypothetical protein
VTWGIYVSLSSLISFSRRWHAAGRLWCVFCLLPVSCFDKEFVGMSSMNWHPSATSPSPCRAHPPQNASAIRTALSHYNRTRAGAQVAARHRRRSHPISRQDNNNNRRCHSLSACPSHRPQVAWAVAAVALRSWTSYTRTRPKRLHSRPLRTLCPTRHRHRALRTRIYRLTATSSPGYPATCTNPVRSRGSRHRKRTRIVISTRVNTPPRRFTGRLPQVTRGHLTGHRQARKHTRRSSRRRLWVRVACLPGRGMGPDKDKDKMGTWTYGTRCRLATSAYSFRFTLARVAHVSGTG